ncbi:MAG: histidinol-phosphatase [Bacteroidales bacterium]|nr:histidinol-phosphatase [Bacteroidales bacterium]MCF8403253.1 histidinol-phosphatase [Bacteroidales bacterium]
MNKFNLHTHTNFCDGKEDPEEYVKRAIDLGFHTLGFSGHAPVPFDNKFAIREEELEDYFQAVRNLRKQYKDHIHILLALEIDFIPGITKDFAEFVKVGDLDYTIGGVHLIKKKGVKDLWFIDGPDPANYDEGLQVLYGGHARKGVEAYYNQLNEMILTQKPDIIAHLDKIKMHNKNRFFSEQEGWYKDLVWKTLKLISKETNCIIEVNTRGLYKKRAATYFPSAEILEQVYHLKIPITLSSDAHQPDELDMYLQEAADLLKDIGFKEVVYFFGKEKKSQKI